MPDQLESRVHDLLQAHQNKAFEKNRQLRQQFKERQQDLLAQIQQAQAALSKAHLSQDRLQAQLMDANDSTDCMLCIYYVCVCVCVCVHKIGNELVCADRLVCLYACFALNMCSCSDCE